MIRRLGAFLTAAVIALFFVVPANAVGPANTALPLISGNLVSGQILTVTDGTWNSAPSSLLYQWFKCSSDVVSSCTSISGATSASYLISASDVGSRFQVSVTALASGGGTTAVSPLSGVAITLAVSTSLPVISGDSTRGTTLTTTQGLWNVSVIVASYQWQRCNSTDISSCSSIPGAIATTYMTTSDDVGKYIRSTVTLPAAGSYGTGTASSLPFGPVTSSPQQVGSATVTGSLFENETVTVGTVSYIAYPAPTLTYQWQRCPSTDVSTCAILTGESSSSHRVTSSDVGSYLRFTVTIQNILGGIIVPSSLSPQISSQSVPSSVEVPSLSGFARVSYPISITTGVWKGLPAPTLAIQWQSCTAQVESSCTDVSAAKSATYYPVFGDSLKFLRARVTATNRVGTAISYSRFSPSVEPNATLMSSPSTTGFGIVGLSYTASSAYWNGITKPISTQWQRCGKKDGSDCVDIAGETKTVYLLTKDDEGKFVRIKQWVPDEAMPVYSVITGDPIYPKVETPVLAPVIPKPVTTPKPVAKPVVKATTITCVKGALSKKVTAISPKCPTGYKKR